MAIESKEDRSEKDLRAAIESRTATIGVVGLGYVGLPLIVAFAKAGFRCLGVNFDSQKCVALRAGCSHVGDVPGAEVSYHDPYVPELSWRGVRKASVPRNAARLASLDCAVLVTDHGYDPAKLELCRLLIDTRNAADRDLPNCVHLWAGEQAERAKGILSGGYETRLELEMEGLAPVLPQEVQV